MRGQVLGVDRESGDGQISGDDGRRYAFRPSDWRDERGPAVGATVDFEAEGDRALRIYHLPVAMGGTAVAPPAPVQPARPNDRNKIIAAVLAFFLGVFGVHRFYLGRTGTGILMLVLTCTIFGAILTGIWSVIDAIRYLVMSDEEFDARYGRR